MLIQKNKIQVIFSVLADLVQWLIVFLLVFTAAALVLSNFSNPLKLRVFSVYSGSMEPSIHLGSLVFIRPQPEYKPNDVITFADRTNPKQTTTHRIVSLSSDQDLGRTTFLTRGDANEDPDPFNILDSQVLGKVIFVLPLLGYLVAFAKTQLGFTFLIVVPATLLIFTELKNIKEQITEAYVERKLRRSILAQEENDDLRSASLRISSLVDIHEPITEITRVERVITVVGPGGKVIDKKIRKPKSVKTTKHKK